MINDKVSDKFETRLHPKPKSPPRPVAQSNTVSFLIKTKRRHPEKCERIDKYSSTSDKRAITPALD